MGATPRSSRSRDAGAKKKVTARLQAALKAKDKAVAFIAQPNRHKCDRAEAAHQLKLIDRQIQQYESQLRSLDDGL